MALDYTVYARVWGNVTILQSTLGCYRITLRAHASLSLSLFLSHFLLLTVSLRAVSRGAIKCYFTAALRADKERLFCLFQINPFFGPQVRKKIVFTTGKTFI